MDGSFLIVLVVFLAGLALYFLPWIVAHNRGHANEGAIFVLNLFLGWSLIGWVVALVWACTSQPSQPQQPSGAPVAMPTLTATPANNERKPCPFCAEPIMVNAIKCKHCGSSLVTNPRDFV